LAWSFSSKGPIMAKFNFSGKNIYGKEIEVEIQEKIREDIKGLSDCELKKIITEDINKIKNV
jgi:FAD synthase